MLKIKFVEEEGVEKNVVAEEGQTLLEVARGNDIDIEGACGGNMACATCHLVVDTTWYKDLPAPSEDERDMLELVYGLTSTSRLGCQVVLSRELDGLILYLPDRGTV
ncbi:MAG: 2Fe-2S ferredoxin [Rhodospirillaceae bacterium]|nr:2Fe-2S ferredoxin [Rhodospirillaceae bacterium]